MASKIMLNINGDLFDMWDFKSIQRADRYNTDREEMDYLILINKNAKTTEYNDLEIAFNTEDEREEKMIEIKLILDSSEIVTII